MTIPITIYGSHTCEDTAIARDRLRALDIPFVERDKEDDPGVLATLEKYGKGSAHTPTIVFGGDQAVLIEPSIEQLESALRTSGYAFTAPQANQFGAVFSSRVAPDFKLPSTRGGQLELGQLRGSRRAVVFFAHSPSCRVCQGFARQLAKKSGEYQEAEARLLVVLQSDIEQARKWNEDTGIDVETLADADGAIKRKYADYFGSALDVHPEGTSLLILDRFTAPRAGSAARDAGGLMSPHEVGEWLRLLECECDE